MEELLDEGRPGGPIARRWRHSTPLQEVSQVVTFVGSLGWCSGARVVVVDQEPGQLPQVADVAPAFGAGVARGFGFLQGLRGKDREEAAGAHGFYGELVEVGGAIELVVR